MKTIILLCVFYASVATSFAQKETFDLATYTPPKDSVGKTWKKEATENITTYTYVNKKKNSWCRINIVKSTISKGNIEDDFNNEWQELIVKNYKPTEAPQLNEVIETEGWKIKAGSAKFTFNNENAMTMLTTISGFERCVSIVAVTNSTDYIPAIQQLLESVEMEKTSPGNTVQIQTTQSTNQPTGNSKFAFTTTNFDDGWTSTVQEDWVEVKKGNIKVLLHYPKEGTIFPADPDVLTNAVWNILVAPRYSNLKNYRTAYISTYNRPYLGMGYATESSTGREVFVLLFRQGEGWIEFITADKNSFIQQYKFDPETVRWDTDSELMNPLAAMKNYNKFAVASTDFNGKWTSDFTGIQQLYNVYTGNYAGMHMNQSNEEFVFNAGNTYNWKLLVVNGMAGNAKFNEVKSSGKLTVPNNWQIKFSMIETRARTYHAFWSCIKGARILNLLDADYPGSGIYTKYGLAK